jgi:hypothetical protein
VSEMKIILDDTPMTVTVEMTSKSAPCRECGYYQGARDQDDVSLCKRANRPLSAAVVQECADGGWFTKATDE